VNQEEDEEQRETVEDEQDGRGPNSRDGGDDSEPLSARAAG
jgi:hypothetical protein